MKKKTKLLIKQKLIGIVVIAITILTGLYFPEGLIVGFFTVPFGIACLIFNVPFLNTEETYEYWKDQK